MAHGGNKAKYQRLFDRMYKNILRQDPRDGEWELLRGHYVFDSNKRPNWNDFASGEGGTMAVRQVAINGRLYWAVGTTYADNPRELAGAVAMTGRLGLARIIHLLTAMKVLGRPEAKFEIWEMDPHLPFEWGNPEEMAKRHKVSSHAELEALDL
jgi:hypothetical protein